MELSIRSAAAEHPLRIGLVADGSPLTYTDIAERTCGIISWLRSRGVGDGSRVALVVAHRIESVLLFFALFELGAPVVLIHPRLTSSERQRLIDDSSPALVVDEHWQIPESDGRDFDPPPVIPSDGRPLAIVYTSGSTGSPKAAVLSRAAFLASARASEQNLRWFDDDRWLLAGPAAHVGPLSILTRCLVARSCVVLTEGSKFSSVEAICDAIDRHRCTIVSLPPPLVDAIIRREPRWDFPDHFRAVLMGSMAASPDLLRRARERRVPALMTYGFTEACSQVATQKLGTPPGVEQGCGQPIPGTEIRLVDGEVQVKGPTLLTEYLHHPSALTSDGWFPTGDLGYFDERGALHINGRRTDRIITGGENVDPLEVEHAFAGIPGIASALVFGVPDDVWGQVVAVALVAAGPPCPDDVIDEHLSHRLADFKRPRHLAWASELPMTPGGKPDRRGAAAKLASSLRLLVRKPKSTS